MYEHDEIIFAGAEEEFKDAKSQILSFPVGDKDILNALAYLPQLRGGSPIYDDTSGHHVNDGQLRKMGPFTLAINTGAYGSAAVLFQYTGNILLIHRDWISEAPPGNVAASWLEEARLETGKNSMVIVPPYHFDVRNSYGLLAALRGLSECRKGGDIVRGREFLRELLRGEVRGSPRLLLGEEASWSRRAMLGGYVWDTGKQTPRDGLYAVLMNALEAAIAPAAYARSEQAQPSAIAADGTRYDTADPRAQGLAAFTDDGLKERVLGAQRRMFESR